MKVYEAPCPVCGKGRIVLTEVIHNIPYFGRVSLMTLKCHECGFKRSDVFCLEERPPMRQTFKVETVEDLNTRVVRSSGSVIKIPELGVVVEPGSSGQGMITNVEGILTLIKDMAEMIYRSAEDVQERGRAEDFLKKLDEAMKAQLKFKLIIEDPYGNSAIIPRDMSRVATERLSEDEAEKLKAEVVI